MLVSLSNKDFVGETLDLPVGERLTGTLAATAVCALAGARIYRVHEVVETRQVVDMVWTIAGRRPPARAIRGLAVTSAWSWCPGVLALLPEYAGARPTRSPSCAPPAGRRSAGCRARERGAGAGLPAGDSGRRHLLDGSAARATGDASYAPCWSSATAARGAARRRRATSTSGRSPSTTPSTGAAGDRPGGPRASTRTSAATCSPSSRPARPRRRRPGRGRADVLYDDDPFGVRYWVVRWER